MTENKDNHTRASHAGLLNPDLKIIVFIVFKEIKQKIENLTRELAIVILC